MGKKGSASRRKKKKKEEKSKKKKKEEVGEGRRRRRFTGKKTQRSESEAQSHGVSAAVKGLGWGQTKGALNDRSLSLNVDRKRL